MNVYTRNISVKVEELDSNIVKAIASMSNESDFMEKAEHFKLEVVVHLDTMKIINVESVLIDGMLPVCGNVIQKVQSLKGLSIHRGYNKKVKETVGGSEGCTHMVELLVEIGRCTYQAYYKSYYQRNPGNKNNQEINCINEYKSKSNIDCIGIAEKINTILNKQERDQIDMHGITF